MERIRVEDKEMAVGAENLDKSIKTQLTKIDQKENFVQGMKRIWALDNLILMREVNLHLDVKEGQFHFLASNKKKSSKSHNLQEVTQATHNMQRRSRK